MAAIDPGFGESEHLSGLLLRRATRLTTAALYFAAPAVAFVLVRPAFRDAPAPAVPASEPGSPSMEAVRKGESVATFAARHGLDLGELLALNPKVDSLSIRPGTELRIG